MNAYRWTEHDKMLELVDYMSESILYPPFECPACHANHVHYYIDRNAGHRGTGWIWCDSCQGCAHFNYLVPDWWEDPSFIDREQLDSTIEYLHHHEKEIDRWVELLLDQRENQ